MRGKRVKKLRKEAYAVYVEHMKQFNRFNRRGVLPFTSVFRQVKKMYNEGLPIFKKTRLGI